MKKTKVLVPALGILCLSMAASVTSTFAWFAANQTVYAKNMQVRSSTPASLVIGQTFNQVGQAQEIVYADPTEANPVKSLAPCTHTDAEGEEAPFTQGLMAVKNGDIIDPNTGLVKVDPETSLPVGTLEYQNVTAGINYVDYVAYIASAGDAIAGTAGSATDPSKKLSVAITNTATGTTGDTVNALSVDFYVKSVTASGTETTNTDATTLAEYKGTLNLAGIDAAANNHVTGAKTTLELFDTADITIPTETGKSAVKVVMRLYFDGALLKDATHAYVYTNNIDTSIVNLKATFSIA